MTTDVAASLIWALWPGSVALTAVLSYRVGAWRVAIPQLGRHGFMPGSQHEGDETSFEEHVWTVQSPPPLAEPDYSRSVDADTEILPRPQDIRPPMRSTPIRCPPWLKRK